MSIAEQSREVEIHEDSGPISPELVLVCPELRERYAQGYLGSGTPAAPAGADPGEPPDAAARGFRLRVSRTAVLVAAIAASLLTLGPDGRLRAIVEAAQPGSASASRAPAAAAPRRVDAQPIPRRVQPKPVAYRPLASPRRALASVQVLTSEIEPPSSLLGSLQDPTPPLRRLSPATAKALVAAARRSHLDWATLAAVLRLRAASRTVLGEALAGRAGLWLTRRLHREVERALAADGGRLAVLAQYNRAVGLDALVSGLDGAKSVLAARVLRDPRITIDPAGQGDVATGQVDVRVLAALLFLAQRPGGVVVSSLVSGHARLPDGSPSPHTVGVAVDISGLGGRPVAGHQQVGGTVDRAIRSLMLLPREARPKLVLSLLALGGPSLAFADHDTHIEISFDPSASPTTTGPLPVLWRTAGAQYGVPWQVLAAVNKIESNFGRNMGPSSAGALGWMQFMPSTWRQYGLDANGDGRADPSDPTDAIFAAARYLAAAGASDNLPAAVFAYNHAQWYVNAVLGLARTIQ